MSTWGMFMSSIKTTRRFPGGGPNVSLVRFSTFASRVLWTSIEEVREEKLIFSSRFLSGDKSRRKFWIVALFEVPLSPTKTTGLFIAAWTDSNQVVRVVSTVGTRISWKERSGL